MDKTQRVFILKLPLSVLHFEVPEPLGCEELIAQIHMEAPVQEER